MTQYTYSAPLPYVIITALLYTAILVAGAILPQHEVCPASAMQNLDLQTWTLVSGISGLIYALFPFLLLALIFCICIVPCLFAALVAKSVFMVVWAAIGIAAAATTADVTANCPVTLGFAIFSIVLLVLDGILSIFMWKAKEND